LLVKSHKEFQRCSIAGSTPHAAMVCEPASVGDLHASKRTSLSQSTQILDFGSEDNRVQCAWRYDKGLNCSSARPFQDRKDAVVFGRFFADTADIQILDLRRKPFRLCDTAGRCSEAQGLGLLSAMEYVSTGSFSKVTNQSQIVGVTSGLQVSCVYSGTTSSGAGFHCESMSVASVQSKAKPYAVVGNASKQLDSAVFVMRDAKSGGSIARQLTSAELEALQSNARTVNQIAKQASRNGALQKNKLSNTAGAATGLVTARSYNPEETDDDLIYGPNYFEAWGDGWGVSFWSDLYGYWFTNWTMASVTEIEQCLKGCDAEAQMRSDACTLLAGEVAALGLYATAVATVTVAITGPGAGIAFLSGLGATAAASQLTDQICKANAISIRDRCRRGCR
jgi:hypothetical protein